MTSKSFKKKIAKIRKIRINKKKTILISEDNPLFDPIDDSKVFDLEEKVRSGEIKTAEEFIKKLKEL